MLTLTASSTATAGTSNLTITGTSGTLTATTSIALTVKPDRGRRICVPHRLYGDQPVAGRLRGIHQHQQHRDDGHIQLDADLELPQWTDISQLWNGIETQSGANVSVSQRELQRQHWLRRKLLWNGLQRHLEQHDQCRTHLVCGERSGLPIAASNRTRST